MQGRLEARELAALRWLLGQALVLIALAGSFSIDIGVSALVAPTLGLVAAATLFPVVTGWIPAPLWRVAPALLLLFIVGDFIASGGDFLPPLFRMLVLLALYRALQARSPREDMQVILLTLFMILVTGVLSLEITFGIQMLFYAPAAMGLLFTANLARTGAPAAAPPEAAGSLEWIRWPALFRRLRERLDRRTLGAGAVLFATATVMALLLFVLLPRFDIGAALPFPRLQTAQSLSGFSDHVRYGDVVSILNDDTIAMRVDVDMQAPPARPYWRMVALDAYYDGGFMVSPDVARHTRTVSHYRFEFDSPDERAADVESTWTLYLAGGVSAYLPAGDGFETLRFRNRTDLQVQELTRVLKTRETNASTLSLRFEGLHFDGWLHGGIGDRRLLGMAMAARDTSDPVYLRETGYPQTTLVVPDGPDNRRIMEDALAALGATDGLAPEEFARRLAGFLRDGRGYSLETRVPPGPADTLLRWVASGQAGHCELYAGAFVLISRYAGYPARLVTGFVGGDWNGFENYYMVRNRHAHAWCEIHDPKRGWLRVDPTPGYGADAGSVEDALAGGRLRLDRTWTAYLDSLRVLWFRRVVQFDSEDQAALAGALKGAGLRGAGWFGERFRAWRERVGAGWRALLQEGDVSAAAGGLLPPLALAAAACSAVWLMRKTRRRRSFEERIRRKAGRLLQRQAENGPARPQLQAIRYGPRDSWPADVERLLRGRPHFMENCP
jgi:protein-glutamine gamma-glutamyltransferase